ncbi:MAG: very short patch repair endonuclease [Halobacteriales archaeon]|nr:very short patch repair endonuclease [Halobacteriales archaeon]
MPDPFGPAVRSRIMSRVRGRDTGPERAVRARVWAAGLRYRTHDRSVPGRPDISHKGKRVAVFLDGCFWHGCPKHYARPASRQAFWDAKLAANRGRRQVVLKELRNGGWRVVQIWECDIARSPGRAAARVTVALGRATPENEV